MKELNIVENPVLYDLPRDLGDNTVLVLPERVTRDGVALYVDSSMELYKELRELPDLEVQYLETPGGYKWVERLGNGEETIIQLILSVPLGVLASAIWYAIQKFATERKDSKNTRIKITIANRNSDPAWIWYEFEGNPEEVRQLAERVINDQKEDSSEEG